MVRLKRSTWAFLVGPLGAGVPTRNAVGLEGSGEACLELAALVGEHDPRRLGQQAECGGKRGLGVAGRLAGHGEGKRKTACGVDEADEVAPAPVADAFDGGSGQARERRGADAFGFAGFGWACGRYATPPGVEAGRRVAHLVWGAGNEARCRLQPHAQGSRARESGAAITIRTGWVGLRGASAGISTPHPRRHVVPCVPSSSTIPCSDSIARIRSASA